MEDEEVVKAPVTRLRRRLSVEQSDDAKSSSLPSTPTKKWGGRKAAKPELDLIDENATETITPKNVTKKTNIKELEMDEKPVTPSRRSARIKSNTSVVLDTTLATDSPRAKRAARRTSQVGSDTEAPLTPARQTRRTRKDSANTDKAETQHTNKPAAPIVEIIAEEPENSSQNSQSSSEKAIELNQSTTIVRRSPRLSLNRNKNIGSKEHNDIVNGESKGHNIKNSDLGEINEINLETSKDHNSNKENESTCEEKPQNITQAIEDKEDDKEVNALSISSTELLHKISSEPSKTENLNKSSSAMLDIQNRHKIHRTKSWTNLSYLEDKDNKYHSDSESIKKNKRALNKKSNHQEQNISLNLKNIEDTSNISVSKKRKSISENEIQVDVTDSSNLTEKLLSPTINNATNLTQATSFNEKPTTSMVLMFIEESDSNPDKASTGDQIEDEDQCVPIAKTHFESQKTPAQAEIKNNIFSFNQEKDTYAVNELVKKNDSCEPMDIDETIPENITVNELTSKTMHISENKTLGKSKQDNCSGDDKNKSGSSSPINTLQTLDKTGNENKSTLVLSHLKDISNENHELQSPQSTTKLKLPILLNKSQDNETHQKKLGITYSTSTPLQQKGLIKNTIAVNSSGITSNNTSKIESFDGTKINKSNTSKNLRDQSESKDDESFDAESNFINDEAEEASDNYQSGDSKDKDEEQYERENEIIQKGETLTSEDELPNDTDYEKDSFVVSSVEEDNDLLDGSGDDLSLRTNELKMTKKSKQKYNERKIKEQKLASREMFESRHKLNVSNKSQNSSTSKIRKNRAIHDSSDSQDLEEIQVNKKKKIRLDSTNELSTNESLNNKSQSQMLSKSLTNESNPNKAVNISIQFIDPKKKDGDADKTQMNMNQTVDPLDDANCSNSSDSSNNVHIENYDSILNDLNKNMKNKTADVSLNLNKKTKKKSASIVDELNLTEVKPHNLKKKNLKNPILESSSNNLNEESNKSVLKESDSESSQEEITIEKYKKSIKDKSKESLSRKRSSCKHNGDDYSKDEISIENNNNEKSNESYKNNEMSRKTSDNESSASIDLHLLFSEDSANVEASAEDEESIADNSFIPLRKSQGKTNILEGSGFQDASTTESAKKKKTKHQKSLGKSVTERDSIVDNNEVHFFMDTTGNHSSSAVDDFFNDSKSIKKTKEKSVVIEDTDKNSDSDAPLEVSNKSAKKAKEPNIVIEEAFNTSSSAANISKSKTPKSDKKKKRLSESVNIVQQDKKSDLDAPLEVSKKSAKEAQEPNIVIEEAVDTSLSAANISKSKTPKSNKKNKRLSESENIVQQDKNSDSDAPLEISNKSAKEAQEPNIVIEEAVNTSSSAANISKSKTPKSDKKNKRFSASENIVPQEANNTSTKKRNSKNLDAADNNEKSLNLTGIADKSINLSVTKTPKREKKKTKRTSESQSEEQKYEASNNEIIAIKGTNNAAGGNNKDNSVKLKLNDKTESGDAVGDTSLNGSKKEKSNQNEDVLDGSMSNKSLTESLGGAKKTSKKISESENIDNISTTKEDTSVGPKKRKIKSSLNQTDKKAELEELLPVISSIINSDTTVAPTRNKKRKISHNVDIIENLDQVPMTNMTTIEKHGQEITKLTQLQNQDNDKKDIKVVSTKKTMTKRKDREDDEGTKTAKMLKVDTSVRTQVPRLPKSLLNKLDDKPKKRNVEAVNTKAISTSNFTVEEAKIKRFKPSNYLEESIYLNEAELSHSKKQKRIKIPKVLPFLPTVSTSSSGYTTNFKVNVLSKEIKFVAKSSDVKNFKNEYLESKKLKRFGTYELYKRNRNIKMSKF